MTTPKEFETKVRELFGIPLDYDLDSVPDDELWFVLNGRFHVGHEQHVKRITGFYDTEGDHYHADKMTWEILTELGYGKAARIIENIEKWYA